MNDYERTPEEMEKELLERFGISTPIAPKVPAAAASSAAAAASAASPAASGVAGTVGGARTPTGVVAPTPIKYPTPLEAGVAGAGALIGGGLAYTDPGTSRGFFTPGAGMQAQMTAAVDAERAGRSAPPIAEAAPNPYRDQLAAMDAAAAPVVAAPVGSTNSGLLLEENQTNRVRSGGNSGVEGTTGEQRLHLPTQTGENAANYQASKDLVGQINATGVAAGESDPLKIRTDPTLSKQGIVVTKGTTNQNALENANETVQNPDNIKYINPRTGSIVYLPSITVKDEKTGKSHRVPDPAAVEQYQRAEREIQRGKLQRDAITRAEAIERNHVRQNLERQAAEHDLRMSDSAYETKRLENATEQASRRAGLGAGLRKVGVGAGFGGLGAYSAYQAGRDMIKAATAPDATLKSVANAATVPDVANVVTGLSMIPYGRAAKVAGPIGGAAQVFSGGHNMYKNGITPENTAQIGAGVGMGVLPYSLGFGSALMAPAAALALKKWHESIVEDEPRIGDSMAAAMGAPSTYKQLPR